MRALSLSRAWDETKAIVVRDGQLLASVSLALVVLPQAVLAVVGLPVGLQASPVSRLVYVLVILIGFAAQIALNRLAIGPSVTVGSAISRGFLRLLPLAAAFLILVLALAVATMVAGLVLGIAGLAVPPGAGQAPPPLVILLLVVIVVFCMAICQLFIPIAAAEAGGPIHLFLRGWQLARGEYLRLLAFVIVVFVGIAVVAFAGQIVFGSAVVIALGPPKPGSLAALVLGLAAGIIQAALTIVTAVMLARIYVQLAGRGGGEASVPTTGH